MSTDTVQPTKPFAVTLDVGSSLLNRTGSWRTERPVYVDRLPPCNHACPAGENIQQWLSLAEEGDYEAAFTCDGETFVPPEGKPAMIVAQDVETVSFP